MWGYWDLNPGPRVSLVLNTSTSGARNDSRYTIPPQEQDKIKLI